MKKLKRKLEEGIVEINKGESSNEPSNSNANEKKNKTVVLMEMDRKTGLVIPSSSKTQRNEVYQNLICRKES